MWAGTLTKDIVLKTVDGHSVGNSKLGRTLNSSVVSWVQGLNFIVFTQGMTVKL